MGGQSRFRPEIVRPVAWSLMELDGFDFEDEILGVLARDYESRRDAVSLQSTSRTGDGGKDAIISATTDLEVLGIPLSLRGRAELRAYVQIKSSKNVRLTLKDFSASLIQTKAHNCDYYILLTNSTVTPCVLFEAQEHCRSKGIEFLILDQFVLGPSLARKKGHRIPVPAIEWPKGAVTEYQFARWEANGRKHVTLDLCLRNLSETVQAAEVLLQSDLGWDAPEPRLTRHLGIHETTCLRLEATRDDPGSPDELDVAVTFGDYHQEITVPWTRFEEAFTPLLAGERNMKLIADITSFIDQRHPLGIVIVTGEAGVGKSRIIEEVRRAREGPGAIFLLGYFDAAEPHAPFHDINRTLQSWSTRDRRARGSLELAEASIEGLLTFIDAVDCRSQLVILLEDLHYADARTLDVLARLVESRTRSGMGAITLILTGRNDHTFINRHFFSFLDRAQMSADLQNTGFHEVVRLSDNETEQVIRMTISDCPETAVKRISHLSMNVPFNIVQVIQYLLDAKLAAVKNRNTVGIVNLYRFNLSSDLPSSIEELILLRLNSLGDRSDFLEIREFLLVAALFEYHVPRQVYDVMLDGLDLDDIDATLFARRFMNPPGRETLTWHHENILHVFGRLAASAQFERAVGHRLLTLPDLFGRLPLLQRGKVGAMAGEDQIALECWQRMIEDVLSIENVSTNNLPKEYFRFLPALLVVFRRTGRPAKDLLKVCLAYAYLGVHHLPLQSGAQSCVDARAMLEVQQDNLQQPLRVAPASDDVEDLAYGLACLKQLEARAAVNMGQLRRAERLMAEVRSEMERSRRIGTDVNIRAEHYTTTSDLYKLYNHRWLAERYLALLSALAQTANSGKLLALARIHQADLDLYVDRKQAVDQNRLALTYTRTHGTARHSTLSGIAVEFATLPMIAGSLDLLLASADRTRGHLEACITNQYSSSVPRAHRLFAAIQFCIGNHARAGFDLAERHNMLALDAAVRYGRGLDLWRIYNDRAVIFARRGERADRVREQLETAVEHLRVCNLTFLGNRDLVSPNLIVAANYLKLLASFSERRAHAFVDELGWYDRPGHLSTAEKSRIVNNAIDFHVLFQEKEPEWLLRDHGTNYVMIG